MIFATAQILIETFKSDVLLISVTAARPYVPELTTPELLRLRSERMAYSSTAPTTGLRR
jgi:hypothetical protein